MRSLRLRFVRGATLALSLLVSHMDVANAQTAPQQPNQAAPGQPAPSGDPEAKPYDQQVYQLAELLGAVHYLRELCGAEEEQTWRNQMRELVSAEGTTALRRARLVDSFNKGYRGYARTYRTCTKPALQAIDRFMEQGATLADGMMQSNR
jgi:uncharacterized protein (TIGR02301 family)